MTQAAQFKPMRLIDLPHVLGNERRSYTHPWTEGIFRDCLKSGYECWLLCNLEKIIGHGILSIAASESHILNVCVHPELQGKGYGRALTKHLLDKAELARAERVFLEVRSSNRVAYELYESLGFNEIGVRENYYPAYAGREDALVLAKELIYDSHS